MTTESKFKRLVEQYQKGRLSGKKLSIMDGFFDALAENSDDLEELKWSHQDQINLKAKIMAQVQNNEEIMKQRSSKHYTLIWFQAAAVFFLAAVCYFSWQQWFASKEAVTKLVKISSVENRSSKIILSDASIVWLKGNSSLVYPEKFGTTERAVTLEGEAIFEVTKNPEVPFVISVGGLTAKVVGTSFGISSKKKKIELIVLTGKVEVSSTNENMIVLPHEKVIFDQQNKKLVKVVLQKEEEAEVKKGTQYDMKFEDTRMAEIIKRIEDKFQVSVKVENPTLLKCMIRADFTDQSLEHTLSIIAHTLHCEFEIKDREVTLRGPGCP